MNQTGEQYIQVKDLINSIETTAKLIGHSTSRTRNSLEILLDQKQILITLNRDFMDRPNLSIYGEQAGSIHFSKWEFNKQINYLNKFLETL